MELTRRLFHRNTLRNDHFPRSCHNNVVLLYYLENGQSQCAEDAGTCCQKQRVYQSKRKNRGKSPQDLVCGRVCLHDVLDASLSWVSSKCLEERVHAGPIYLLTTLCSAAASPTPSYTASMNPQFQQTFKKMLRIRVNNLQPVSSRANDKGTRSSVLDGHPIEDMPSISIQTVPVFRIQNQVETTSSHNVTDKTDALVNSLTEDEDNYGTLAKPLILKQNQAWK